MNKLTRRPAKSSRLRARSRADHPVNSTVQPGPERAKALLDEAGVRPSRGLGQNFLVQPAIADRIVSALGISGGDTVVEVGPGLGILSERLLMRGAKRLVLVELDRELAERLCEHFASEPSVEIIENDFLELDLPSLLGAVPARVVGNLPFNVAAAILRKLCNHASLVSRAVLMFQREVAERIRAHPGDPAYSALSVFTGLYWQVESHFTVGAGNFHPRPKVDAEVLCLVPRPMRLFDAADEPAVLATVRAAFSSPRKMLRNALAKSLGLPPGRVELALRLAVIDPRARAERLGVEDFVRLAHELKPVMDAATNVARRDA
ncbi:MAG: 16S rRNA (adenine(1518)-N(6)/adenine(1519)-N(6))-dimethyltransferase RsmA [Candidatus Binataceae bacterium]